MHLAPHRPYRTAPPPGPAVSLASKFTPEIEGRAVALGLIVTSEADDLRHAVAYVFRLPGPDGFAADPLYSAKGAHSALRFLDHYAARL